MNRLQTFQQFLATQSVQIPVLGFILNFFLAAILSFILSRIYIKYASSLSNRRIFANNFMLLTMTTMLIITIVKSSLALSLGLVGALSIVRFRAAIKEPEELSYLFLAIAVGLGLGANQWIITVVAFVILCGLLILKKSYHVSESNQNFYLTIASHDPQKITLEQIVKILRKYCVAVDMKRFDGTKEMLEASFMIDPGNFEELELMNTELQKLNDSVKITFLDSRGVV